jgi:hypothetical protein
MTAFVLLMASFMYRAAFNQEELVAENYYEQEIKYQEQIDKLNRAGALGEAVRMEVVGNELVISFPQEVQGRALSGELYLQRPSDARADARLPVSVDSLGQMRVPIDQRMKGAYNTVLEWRADGDEFLSKDRIYIP